MDKEQKQPQRRYGVVAKRVLVIGSSIFVVLVAIMAVHIYDVTTPRSDGFLNTNLQLARIDFSAELSHTEKQNVESFVKSLPGIKSTFMNARANVLVYTYLLESAQILKNRKSNIEPISEAIVRKVNDSGLYEKHIQAKRYFVSPTTNGSCPIDGKQMSIYKQIGVTMHNILD